MANDADIALKLVDEDDEPIEEEEVDLGEDSMEVPPYLDDDPNLVSKFMTTKGGLQELKKLAHHMLSEFDTGWESTAEYRERFARDWLLLAGDIPDKQGVYKHCANTHIPVALENISRLTLRAFGEIFGDRQNVMRVHKIDEQDDTADKLTLHGNWQLRTQIPDFYRQMHRACLAFFFIGDCTVHSYYDETRKINRHELLTPDEFVVPYKHHTTMPDYSDVPWRAKIMFLYEHELEAYRGSWEYIDESIKHKASPDDEPEQTAGDILAEHQDQDSKAETKYAPHKVILWEGWVKLPHRDRQMFVQGHLHYATRRLLKLRVYEEPTWQEKLRYKRQVAERDAYQQQLQQYMAQMQQLQQMQQQADQAEQMVVQTADAGAPVDVALAGLNAVENAREQIPPPPPPPRPPSWMQDPNDPMEEPPAMRREPVHLFAHGVCLEPLVGNLGLSYGRMQADHNRAVNILLNQFIDSATFANIKDYFARSGLELPEELVREPGKIHQVGGAFTGNIRDEIMELGTSQANPQLVQLVELISEYAQSSVQASDILSGEPGKSGETYRGVAARIEQATKQLSVVATKFVDMVTQVLLNNAKLNAVFLEDEEVIQITDHMMGPKTLTVGRQMYERNYSVEITADMRFATQVQKAGEADELVAMVFGSPASPLLTQYQDLTLQVLQEAFRARGKHQLAQMVSQPPPPPQMPPGTPPGAPPGAPPQGPPQ